MMNKILDSIIKKIFFHLSIFIATSFYGQIIHDVKVFNDTSSVVIVYKIKECPTNKFYDISLKANTIKGIYTPEFLIGDFQHVDCFGTKKIVWKNYIDSVVFSESDKILLEISESMNSPLLFNLNKKYNTIIDIENNSYRTIEIGKQTWMAENLRVSHFKNGDKIDSWSEGNSWINSNLPLWTNYDLDPNYEISYGKLYNWSVVQNEKGICPNGWRVPKEKDWKLLQNYISKKSSGGSLKEVGISKWKFPNKDASNYFGFTGVPSGYMDIESKFVKLGIQTSWWSSTVYYYDYIIAVSLNNSNENLLIGTMSNKVGLPIRCIKE
jgi:uncharacterized protein (TIGR02145 family)